MPVSKEAADQVVERVRQLFDQTTQDTVQLAEGDLEVLLHLATLGIHELHVREIAKAARDTLRNHGIDDKNEVGRACVKKAVKHAQHERRKKH